MKEELLSGALIENPHKCGIYVIRSISGGEYVGSSTNIRKRLRGHEKLLAEGLHHSRALQAAWIKHGPDGFTFHILLVCSRRNLLLYEQAVIDIFKPKYNMSPTAGNCLGVKHSAETRKKQASYGMLGKQQSAFQRERCRQTHLGKSVSQDTREKMSRTAKLRLAQSHEIRYLKHLAMMAKQGDGK